MCRSISSHLLIYESLFSDPTVCQDVRNNIERGSRHGIESNSAGMDGLVCIGERGGSYARDFHENAHQARRTERPHRTASI